MNLPLLEKKLMGWIILFIIEEYLLVMNAIHKAMQCAKQKGAELWSLFPACQHCKGGLIQQQ